MNNSRKENKNDNRIDVKHQDKNYVNEKSAEILNQQNWNGNIKMTTVQREVSDRTGFGKLVKWIFIGFNVLMAIWLVSAIGTVSEIEAPQNSAEEAGAAIGATLGFGMLLFVWAVGDMVLGLFVLLTRRKKLITAEE